MRVTRKKWTIMVLALIAGLAFQAPRPRAQTVPSRLTFDGSGHLVMNDVKKFGLGVYDSGIGPSTDSSWWDTNLFNTFDSSTTTAQLKSTRGLGGIPLNMYLNYHRGEDDVPETRGLLQSLGKHNVMYFQTANCFGGTSYTATPFSVDQNSSYAQQLADPTYPDAAKAIAGYYLMDECDDSLLHETRQHNQTLVGYDSGAVNLAVPVAYGDRDPNVWVNPQLDPALVPSTTPSAGLFGTDPYPLYGAEPRMGYPHFRVPDQIARLRARQDQPLSPTPTTTCGGTGATTSASKSPVLAVLQLFKFNGARLPTPAEMKMHAYASIVEGAQGIFWWSVGDGGLRDRNVKTTEISKWTGYLASLVTEISGLNDALVAAPPPTDPLVSNSSATRHTATGTPTSCADAIEWRKAAIALDLKNSGLSYADKQWYQAELTALQNGDTSRSPMLQATPGVAPLQAGDIRTRTFYGAVGGGNAYVVVAYNYTNQTESVTFGWNSPLSNITVWNEATPTMTSTSNTFTDTFGPFQAHVYVIR